MNRVEWRLPEDIGSYCLMVLDFVSQGGKEIGYTI
jgi:hypothetical protein